jgi:hypothetical protein
MYQDKAGTNPVTSSGQSVKCWKNKSQTLNHATCDHTLIKFYTNSINGKAALRTDPGSQMFFNNNLVLSGYNDCTFILIYKLRNTSQGSVHPFGRYIFGDFSWIDIGGTYENLGFNQRYSYMFNDDIVKPHTYILIADHNTNTKIYKDTNVSTPFFTGTYSSASFSVAQWMGSSFGTGVTDQAGMNLFLCEMILYNRVLSESTTPKLSSLINQLCSKWGVI